MKSHATLVGPSFFKRLSQWVLYPTVVLLLLAIGTFSVYAQEPILTFLVEPEHPVIAPGEKAVFHIIATSNSVHEADDVIVTFTPVEGVSIEPSPETINRISPFSKATFVVDVSASENLPVGEYILIAEAVYTYCIDVSCFQIDEELTFPVTISEEETMVSPISPQVKRSPLRWLAPTLGALLILGAILLWRFAGLTLPLYLILVLLIVGGLTYGVILKQHEQAQGIAAVLCTSCVGIEEARHEAPKLNLFTLSALKNLAEDVELIVFYAPWCHSCPYAEAMVEAMAAQTEHITYRFIDVDEQRDLAASHGIVRSNRTVVPSILRLETGEVIFGVGELEERLLSLLGVEK